MRERSVAHPLVVTSDPALLDDLLRLATAGACEVRVAADPGAAQPIWSAAPFVLVGMDALAACVRRGLAAPPSVVVVGHADAAPPTWRLAQALQAEQVAALPAAEAWLVDRFADHACGQAARARVVAIVGGCGGAGASVLAAGLAVTASRRRLEVLLVDADPLGGGLDLVLGWEQLDGLRWPDLAGARGRVNPPALVEALPGQGGLAVLSFDRGAPAEVPVQAMAAALDAGRRGRDLVVVDLPRRLDDAAQLALATAEHAYLVVPAQLRACAAARRVAATAAAYCGAISLVVRDPVPGTPPAEQIAAELDLPLAATVRSQPGLRRELAAGAAPAATGRGPLAQVCRTLLADIRPRRHRAGAR